MKFHKIMSSNEKKLTLQDMFKKIKYYSATKSNNSGCHCSNSRTFLVQKTLISVFNYRIYMCSHF